MFWFIFFLYQFLYPVAFLVSFPSWLLKMKKRNGFGTGISQRFGLNLPTKTLPKGAIYIHAVSVGEVKIALKIMRELGEKACILAVTTSSGYHVAQKELPRNATLIYSPIDCLPVLHHVFSKISPIKVVMIDSEIWPNLFLYLKKVGIPLTIANGRLSDRSYQRYFNYKKLLKPIFSSIKAVSVDSEEQANRWKDLDVSEVFAVGSLKFEPYSIDQLHLTRQLTIKEEWAPQKKIILLASTHPDEELWIYQHLAALHCEYAFAICPRHIERADQITSEFSQKKYKISSLSNEVRNDSVLLIDQNGELLKWMAVADLVIIGKSFLKKGGQNPFESMSLGIPTICGPDMQNFEPLVTECHEEGALIKLAKKEQLLEETKNALISKTALKIRSLALRKAQQQLSSVDRTIRALEL